jgi:hypothetical protein
METVKEIWIIHMTVYSNTARNAARRPVHRVSGRT